MGVLRIVFLGDDKESSEKYSENQCFYDVLE